jgi:hypothetical protein
MMNAKSEKQIEEARSMVKLIGGKPNAKAYRKSISPKPKLLFKNLLFLINLVYNHSILSSALTIIKFASIENRKKSVSVFLKCKKASNNPTIGNRIQ